MVVTSDDGKAGQTRQAQEGERRTEAERMENRSEVGVNDTVSGSDQQDMTDTDCVDSAK